MSNPRRPFMLRVRLSEQEHENLKAKATKAGLDVSGFVRVSCGLASAKKRQDPAPKLDAGLQQIARIQNNLSQIVKDMPQGIDRQTLLAWNQFCESKLDATARGEASPQLSAAELSELTEVGKKLNALAHDINSRGHKAGMAKFAIDTLRPSMAALGCKVWV